MPQIDKNDLRWYIFTCYKLGENAKAIIEQLTTIYGDAICSERTVRRWIKAF